jgi:hypothetical protein
MFVQKAGYGHVQNYQFSIDKDGYVVDGKGKKYDTFDQFNEGVQKAVDVDRKEKNLDAITKKIDKPQSNIQADGSKDFPYRFVIKKGPGSERIINFKLDDQGYIQDSDGNRFETFGDFFSTPERMEKNLQSVKTLTSPLPIEEHSKIRDEVLSKPIGASQICKLDDNDHYLCLIKTDDNTVKEHDFRIDHQGFIIDRFERRFATFEDFHKELKIAENLNQIKEDTPPVGWEKDHQIHEYLQRNDVPIGRMQVRQIGANQYEYFVKTHKGIEKHDFQLNQYGMIKNNGYGRSYISYAAFRSAVR